MMASTQEMLRAKSVQPYVSSEEEQHDADELVALGDELRILNESERDSITQSGTHPCIVCGTECENDTILCNLGQHWVHYKCAHLTEDEIELLEKPENQDVNYECPACTSILDNLTHADASQPDQDEDAGIIITEKNTEDCRSVRGTPLADKTPGRSSAVGSLILSFAHDPPLVGKSPGRNTAVELDVQPTVQQPVDSVNRLAIGPLVQPPAQQPVEGASGNRRTLKPVQRNLNKRKASDKRTSAQRRDPTGSHQSASNDPEEYDNEEYTRKMDEVAEKEKLLRVKERNLQSREKLLKEQEKEATDLSRKLACTRAYTLKLEDEVKAVKEENRFLMLRLSSLSGNPSPPNPPPQPATSSTNNGESLNFCRLENQILQMRLEQSNKQAQLQEYVSKQSHIMLLVLQKLEKLSSTKKHPVPQKQSANYKHNVNPPQRHQQPRDGGRWYDAAPRSNQAAGFRHPSSMEGTTAEPNRANDAQWSNISRGNGAYAEENWVRMEKRVGDVQFQPYRHPNSLKDLPPYPCQDKRYADRPSPQAVPLQHGETIDITSDNSENCKQSTGTHDGRRFNAGEGKNLDNTENSCEVQEVTPVPGGNQPVDNYVMNKEQQNKHNQHFLGQSRRRTMST